jgi:hypothetical protein
MQKCGPAGEPGAFPVAADVAGNNSFSVFAPRIRLVFAAGFVMMAPHERAN